MELMSRVGLAAAGPLFGSLVGIFVGPATGLLDGGVARAGAGLAMPAAGLPVALLFPVLAGAPALNGTAPAVEGRTVAELGASTLTSISGLLMPDPGA